MTTFTTDDRINAEKIEDVTLDATDAFYTFDEEQGNIFSDDDRMLFVEGFNQGMEAMRKATLTLLEGEK
jgi:hypothetical protein